jgi:3-oxoacyl-[acyl-carrier protein] reductase
LKVLEDKMPAVQEKPAYVIAKRLTGKIAVVTGGSRGIGAAIALRLAAEGANVVITYNSNQKAADKVVAQATEHGVKAIAVKANASSKNDNDALINVVKKLGKIDILVNNAAIFEGGPIDQTELELYDRLFETNVRGIVATTIAALKNFNDGGRIINISSGAARASMAGFSLYSGTKGAMEAITRGWAQDLGARGITVNAVAPGVTVTDMMEAGLPQEMQSVMVEKTALKRLGQPEDIAAAVAFLASADGGWVTGKVLDADGGLAF